MLIIKCIVVYVYVGIVKHAKMYAKATGGPLNWVFFYNILIFIVFI